MFNIYGHSFDIFVKNFKTYRYTCIFFPQQKTHYQVPKLALLFRWFFASCLITILSQFIGTSYGLILHRAKKIILVVRTESLLVPDNRACLNVKPCIYYMTSYCKHLKTNLYDDMLILQIYVVDCADRKRFEEASQVSKHIHYHDTRQAPRRGKRYQQKL